MSVIIFNGVTSASVHAHITEPPEYTIPEREYETIHVGGRNGDLIIDSGCYKNVDAKYKMSMDATKDGSSYSKVASAIATWLHPLSSGTRGYYRLQDSYDPEHFRLARFKGDEDISNIFNKAGEFDLSFECMPQRYLISGEKTVLTAAGTATNPTSQIARPKITATASAANGYIQIVNSSYGYYHRTIISTASAATTIDSEDEDCYSGTTNRNGIVSFKIGSGYSNSYEFPMLYPGANVITLSNISSFSLIPNWWEL